MRGSDPELRLHLSAPAREGEDGAWLVELRRAGKRFTYGRPGQVLLLPVGGTAVLLERYGGARLWRAALRLPAPVLHYLGAPRRADSIPARRARLAARPLPDRLRHGARQC